MDVTAKWIDDIAARLAVRGPRTAVLPLASTDRPVTRAAGDILTRSGRRGNRAIVRELLGRLWFVGDGPVHPARDDGVPALLIHHVAVGTGGPAETDALLETVDSTLRRIPPDASADGTVDGPADGKLLGRGLAPWIVLEGADVVLESPAALEWMRRLWSEARRLARPLHLVLLVQGPAEAARLLALLGDHPVDALPPPPDLSLRALAESLPDWPSHRIVTARALLGDRRDLWSQVDSRLSLSSNLLRLVLDPDAPAFDAGLEELAGAVRQPARYAAIVGALANGAHDWGGIVERATDFDRSSQIGPYMRTLEEIGWVVSERSLDAGPRSRRTRYRIADDLHAFWFSCVLPVRSRLLGGENRRRVWAQTIRPKVRSFVASRVEALIRREFELETVLGYPVRESGGLWGDGYDLPISGTLQNGGVYYGVASWEAPPPAGTLERIRRAMRETRYGFGRQARLRLLFVRDDPDHDWERRIARSPDARLLGPRQLVGRAR